MICRSLALASVIGLLAACAPPASVPPSGNLAQDVRRLQSSLDSQEQSLQRLARQVTELEGQLARQAQQLEQLKEQPRQAETGRQAVLIPTLPAPPATAVQGEGSPTEVYLQAFGDYASGRYQAAVHGFENFLQRFPNNSYASNAQFWLADCYFNQQQYAQAIEEFEQVLNDYPNAPKNPDALLKIAIAHLQLGAPDEARQAVATLSRRYPKSTATQKAQDLAIP